MKLSNNKISELAFKSLGALILYVIFDSIFLKKKDNLSTVETLQKSSFARIMFVDIGILSAILGGWIINKTNTWYKWFFGISSFFVGSFAILPFLGLYYRDEELTIEKIIEYVESGRKFLQQETKKLIK